MSHVWVIERKEMYTNDNYVPCDFALTRRVARLIIQSIVRFRNLNSKGPHHAYIIKKYTREE